MTVSIGQISIKFVPCIFKISYKKTKETFTKKRKCLHYFLLCLFCYINLILGDIGEVLDVGEFTYAQSNLIPNKDFILMANIEMVLIFAISIFLLNINILYTIKLLY